jgi:hypothetical protein
MHYHGNSNYISGFKQSHYYMAMYSLWINEINHKHKGIMFKSEHPQIKKTIVVTQESKVDTT